jgi:hypothetical protein
MALPEPHQCRCSHCQESTEDSVKEQHYLLNLLLTRLDEQQRRWAVALESKRLGYGGDVQMSKVTGMDEKTIRRGRRELDSGLADRPVDQVRLPGAGRPPIEKKLKLSPNSLKSSSKTR